MLKVIIVEDEPIILKGLLYRIDWLKTNCIVIGTAESGIEGCQLILEKKPDIVITDIRMPFKDGLEMLQETKDVCQYEAIILSGYGEFQYAQQAIRLGVHNYLLKPVDLKDFEATLHELAMSVQEKRSSSQSNSHRHVLDLKVEWTEGSSYAADAIRYIEKHYDQKISLAMASKVIGLSTVSVNTKLKERTGYSFNELLTRYRLTKAIQKLQHENSLVYEVAEQTGFSDYKYFSAVFKKYIGTSPKQFLKKGM
ncbi:MULTISPECIES: response regulator transcription factor [Shouchella]|uniref:Response regulator n=1 Tax=Shouchella hunanensis TaxID=766894 RepID=A0ABY7W5K0_9BACI|nr:MULTISPECIES: response regulator [Shouchella]WDF03346.1 response regulator [Shouchella hunanensis]GAF24181.1 two-component response regulator [Bacillus sp. JCM 19047]